MTDNRYVLMNKDRPVLQFETQRNDYGQVICMETGRSMAPMPIGMRYLQNWLMRRQAPKHREHILELLRRAHCDDLEGYLNITHALTLNDTFWVKHPDDQSTWDDVSLYRNDFNEVIARTAFEGGIHGDDLSTTSPEYGTDGAYAKCWVREEDGIYLLKSGSAQMGYEPYSEFYAAQVAEKVCRDRVPYTLAEYRGKLVSKCKLFTSESEGYAAANKLLPPDATISDLLRYFDKLGSVDDFRRMLVLDALIVNSDRHMGNFGVIFDSDTMQIKRMAPVFDHNQSLMCYAQDKDMSDLDRYLSTKAPKIGEDYNTLAHDILMPEIRSDLLNLRGFTFQRDVQFNLPPQRLRQLEGFIGRQVDNILERRSFYMSFIKTHGSSLDEKIQAANRKLPQQKSVGLFEQGRSL